MSISKDKLTPEQKKVLKVLLNTNATAYYIQGSRFDVERLKARPAVFLADPSSPIFKHLLAEADRTLGDNLLSAEELLGNAPSISKKTEKPV